MKRTMLVLLLISVLVITGCGADDPEPAVPETHDDPEPAEPEAHVDPDSHDDEEINAPPMVLASGPLVVDGLATDYPAESFEAMGTTIHMAYYGDLCYIHLETNTDGWLAAGMNTTGGGMNGAMMILGYLEGDSPAYREDLGGSHNHSAVDAPALDQFYFEHSDGRVVMEFSYPLVFPAGNGYNVESLEPGQTYTLILATHNDSYDISMMHNSLVHFDFTVEP